MDGALTAHCKSAQHYPKRSAATGSQGLPGQAGKLGVGAAGVQPGWGGGPSARGGARAAAPPRQRPETAGGTRLSGAWRSPRPAGRTHLATASTEPGIGTPPSSLPSYSTPEMSSSTPRTPASRSPHEAIALCRAPQSPRVPVSGGELRPGSPRRGAWEM